MITDNRTFFLGFFIFVLPLLGLPMIWKFALIMLVGIFFMLMSVKFSLPKREKQEETQKEKHEEKTFPLERVVEKENDSDVSPLMPKKRIARPRKKKMEDISF